MVSRLTCLPQPGCPFEVLLDLRATMPSTILPIHTRSSTGPMFRNLDAGEGSTLTPYLGSDGVLDMTGGGCELQSPLLPQLQLRLSWGVQSPSALERTDKFLPDASTIGTTRARTRHFSLTLIPLLLLHRLMRRSSPPSSFIPRFLSSFFRITSSSPPTRALLGDSSLTSLPSFDSRSGGRISTLMG